MFNNTPKHSGIYHIKDNIDELQLKIYFRHVNSLLKLPKFDVNRNVATDPLLGSLTFSGNEQNQEQGDTTDTTIIKWQQKLLSAEERRIYRDEANCTTETHRKYHEWIVEEEEAERKQQQLQSEEASSGRRGRYKNRRKKSQKKTSIMASEQTETSERASLNSRIHEIFTYTHEDNFQPEKCHKRDFSKRRTVNDADNNIVYMYIYAALKPDTQLVSLQWHADKHMLVIYPDFNHCPDEAYFIEIDTDYRHLYAYGCENVSQSTVSIERIPQIVDFLHFPELTTAASCIKKSNPLDSHRTQLANEFALPPRRTKRISLLLEIRTAAPCTHDNIHIRYHMILPANVILEEGLLHASTHSSSLVGASGSAHHFGHTTQLTVLLEETFNVADRLHIYFEVISIDSWERERIEGYAHYAIPLIRPSQELVQLPCVRPLASSIWQSLSYHFIGGRPQFDYISFFTPELADGVGATGSDLHSRYGCRMRSSGWIQVSCQSFTQRNADLLVRRSANELGRGGGMSMTLDDILLAYREARHRLEVVSAS